MRSLDVSDVDGYLGHVEVSCDNEDNACSIISSNLPPAQASAFSLSAQWIVGVCELIQGCLDNGDSNSVIMETESFRIVSIKGNGRYVFIFGTKEMLVGMANLVINKYLL